MSDTWIALGVVGLIALSLGVLRLLMSRPATSAGDLGAISEAWLAEHRGTRKTGLDS